MSIPTIWKLSSATKFAGDSAPVSPDDVDDTDRDILIAAFVDRAIPAPVGSTPHTLVKSLIQLDAWLLCHCRGDDLAKAPVLYPQRVPVSPSRPLTLVRNHARGLHNPLCPFARDPSGEGSGVTLAKIDKSDALGVLGLTGRDEDREPLGNGSVQQDSTRASPVPTLARVLFTLLEAAGCDRLSFPQRALGKDADRVATATKGRYMDKQKGLKAENHIASRLTGFAGVATRVTQAWRDEWSKTKLDPHGLVMGLCDFEERPDGSKWLLSPFANGGTREEWEVKGRVRLPGAGTSGPYVAMGLVGIVAGTKSPAILQAYLHPAYGYNDLTLVDSDLERRTLAILCSRMDAMRKQGRPYTVIKHYTDIVRSPTERYRPDFSVVVGSKTTYIETMGYTDAEYVDRKTRTHAMMGASHALVLHMPGENDDALQTTLDRLVGFKPDL